MNFSSRKIIRGTLAPLAAALVFCSTDLHAAWSWTFPFFHEEKAQPLPSNSAPATVQQIIVQPPVPQPIIVKPPTPPARLQPPAELKLPESVIGTTVTPPPAKSPAIILISPSQPTRKSEQPATPGMEKTETPDTFADAQRIDATVYREDVQWQGRVRLDGWITVAPQATLTVSPGATVRLAPGTGIHLLGRIVVKGTAENPVLIAPLSREPVPGEWRGIVISGSEKNNLLEHVRIEGAQTALLARFSSFSARSLTIGRSVAGLRLQESVASLSGGVISGNDNGIVADNSELTMDSVTVQNNHSGINLKSSSLMATEVNLKDNRTIGLLAEGSQLKLDRFTVSGSETGAQINRGEGSITASGFRDNSEAGASLTGSRIKLTGNLFSGNRIGLQLGDHLPVLWGNALIDNKSYNFLYLGEEIYYLGGNWLGAGGRESSERTVFSRRSGAVQVEPLLKANPLSGN